MEDEGPVRRRLLTVWALRGARGHVEAVRSYVGSRAQQQQALLIVPSLPLCALSVFQGNYRITAWRLSSLHQWTPH